MLPILVGISVGITILLSSSIYLEGDFDVRDNGKCSYVAEVGMSTTDITLKCKLDTSTVKELIDQLESK